MADTSQQALSEPHTNGVVDDLTEDEKSKMRPADIDADMREMERRKRVEMMMNSRIFREELERIIETQMKDGAGPSGLLQQISDMMGAQGARFTGNGFKNSNCVLPINDIRGVESMGYAKGEKLLRCKLAAVFRLLDLYGWTQNVGGQITARLNQDQEHFLVNPYGLLYHEVTASSLIKVDMQGAIVEQGTTNFGVHVTGFQLHSTIHAARPDIKCIIHITTPSVTAISSLKCGLLPIGQESIVIGEVSNHQYVGGSVEPEEREKIARNLGPINKVMLLTNRGALCCGETVEEAFFNVYNTVIACETQLKLMPAGVDNLNLISEESKKAIFEASRKPPSPQQQSTAVESSALAEKMEKRWRIGSAEFEALMRMLDNAGFRTGYIYRNPLVKGEPPRPRNDVEVPPAVSSLGYLLEEEELYKQGLWKGGRKGTDRSRWLNSPNVYQKVEILETGTPDPKKITKWVSDGSPTHSSSTPVKIDSALQFVPKNTNPKEFKQIQQQIKDYRRADKISAGPQSHILEGVSWEEAKKMQDATISGTGEQVVLVGAASKGIIQRGFQHNAMVYKTPYAKNPFDAVTDQELDQYKREVERKQKGDPYDESQSESEALSSFNISRATHESSTAKSPIQSPVSVTSETEEESRDEPRVLRIETKQVPAPSQPEVVLSDDCELSSSYSSVSSERARMHNDRWFSEYQYDRLHLENVRIMTTAERKKPILITRSRTVFGQSHIILPRSRDAAFRSRYEARRKFFEDLEHGKTLATKTTESETKAKKSNIGRISDQNLTLKPNKYSHPRKIYSTGMNVKKRIAYLNGKNDTAVKWKSIARPSSAEVINIRETELSIRDVKTLCPNGDSRIEKKTEGSERIENCAIKKIITVTPENDERLDDPSDSTIDVDNQQQLCTETVMITTTIAPVAEETRSCAETYRIQHDNSEDSSQPLSDLSSNDSDGHSSERYEHEEDITADRMLNEQINGNEISLEQKEQNLQTRIEDPICDSDLSHGREVDDTYETYCNDITKIVVSIDMNISSSRTELDTLPDTDTCLKYNLDSTNMSLIYSLTPSSVVNQEEEQEEEEEDENKDEENDNDNTSRDVAEWSSNRLSDSKSDDNSGDAFGEYWSEWMEPTSEVNEGSLGCPRECSTPTDNSGSCELEQPDLDGSASFGSDILELPARTILELKDIDGEVFQNGINESANEIIADLNATDEALPSSYDAFQIAQNIVSEIIDCVYGLSYLDSSIYDLGVVREVVRHLIDSYRYEYSLLMGSTGQGGASEMISGIIDNDKDDDDDNVCQIKGFLSPDSYCNNNRAEVHDSSSAVIEFCTVAKRLPIVAVNNGTVELNFRVVKVATNGDADKSSTCSVFHNKEKSTGNELGRVRYGVKGNENAIRSENKAWLCERCPYCREEEESTREKHRLPPITEELEEYPLCETVDCSTSTLENHNDELRHDLDDVEEITASSAERIISLDDTYTISESSDNSEMNDSQDKCDDLNSSLNYLSYSYDTKEFIRLERAIANDSRLNT